MRITSPRTAYTIGLALIFVLGTVQLIGTRYLASRQEVAALEINLSGRQRMLSQRIALTMEQLAVDPGMIDEEMREGLRGRLLACIALMERSHMALVARDPAEMRAVLGSGAACFASSAPVSEVANAPDLSEVPLLAAFLDRARGVATMQGAPQAGESGPIALGDVRPDALLAQLDAATFNAQEESIAEVRTFLTLSWFLLIALVAGEALFLFQPMARRVEVSIRRLTQANARLAESERRLQDFASSAADEFWETDADHRFVWLAASGTGARVQPMPDRIGKTLLEVAGDGDADDVDWDRYRSALRARVAFENFEYRLVGPDGRVTWWRAHGRPVVDVNGAFRGYRGTALDITEEKREQAQARQAERMRSLGQLTAGVAHDFNNLLSVIQGNAELIDVETEPVARRQSVAEIVAAVERGASLTGRLLAFGRGQTLKAEPVDIAAFFKDVSDLLTRTLGEDFTVRAVVPEEPIWVFVDRHQLEDAFLNLAINARDACGPGGVLTIAADVRNPVVHMPLSGRDFGAGDLVCVSFADNGCGIAPAALSRIFEPFYTTKPVGEGSGLGLSMVYGFALQSGGFLDVSSEPGVGTRVDLFLPRATAGTKAAPQAEEPVPEPAKPMRVLLLEDNDAFRRVARRMLEHLGAQVSEAGDGETALSLMRSGGPYDLLIADILLPGEWNGAETAARARSLQPGLPVVFCSGFFAPGNGSGTYGLGAQPLLRKPYRSEQLAEAIEKALALARAPSQQDK